MAPFSMRRTSSSTEMGKAPLWAAQSAKAWSRSAASTVTQELRFLEHERRGCTPVPSARLSERNRACGMFSAMGTTTVTTPATQQGRKP